MGGSKKQTVGYAYFMGLHMVISKGPVDALLKILAGDRVAWDGTRYRASTQVQNGHFNPPWNLIDRLLGGWGPTGQTAPVTASERIILYAPDLFGGKKKEGGICGALDVMFGEDTQGSNDYLTNAIGAAQPAYRGVLSAVFRGGMVGAINPYLKAWAWRVRRNLKGWEGGTAWYPETCEINVGNGVLCMNPAHIIYQVLTDSQDGMGYPRAVLDDASFRAAADLFKYEGLGLFINWNSSEKLEEFIRHILDHCNALLSQDPATGLFKIVPMRDDYLDSELLELNPSNAVLETWERATLEETVNEITVKWDDTYTGKEASLTVQALASIQAMGGVVNQTKTYAGVPTQGIASQLAQRDLNISSALLARCRIKASRVAANLIPGNVVKLTGFTKLGIGTAYIRVLRVNYGGPDGQTVTIEGAEDVFGLPVNSYIGVQPPGWTEPDGRPVPAPNMDAFEIPYRDLVQILGSGAVASLSPATGYLGVATQRPTSLSTAVNLYTRQGSADYQGAGTGDFTPTGTLQSPIGKTDTSITLNVAQQMSEVYPGMVAFIGPHPTAEAVRIDAADGALLTIARGALDTVPKAWAAGTRVWVYDEAAAVDPQEYAAGESVDAKAATVATQGELDISLAPVDSVTFNSRAARPYPPARFRINNAAWPVDAWGTAGLLTASWVHRSRTAQADVAVSSEEGTIGPEAGTTYTARWYLDNTLVRTQTGITGTSDSYTPPEGSGGKTVTVTVESVRDGLTSWQAQTHTFIYRAYLVTEAGDRITTEEGDYIILE